MKFIETHFHLDYLKEYPHEEILRRSRACGVERFITISVEPDNLKVVRELASEYDDLFCSQGIHPHDAVKATPQDLQEIEQWAKNFSKCVAIGEIGLDYHYNHSPKNIQQDIFRQQLDIASRLNIPVIIHSRDADEDTECILKEFPSLQGVIHSFTSGKKLAQYALGREFFLGFNGIITFKSAQNVRDILKMTPEHQILLETDAPFLTPVPHRGKENAPFYIPLIAEKVAQIKGKNPHDMEVFYENSLRLFWSH